MLVRDSRSATPTATGRLITDTQNHTETEFQSAGPTRGSLQTRVQLAVPHCHGSIRMLGEVFRLITSRMSVGMSRYDPTTITTAAMMKSPLRIRRAGLRYWVGGGVGPAAWTGVSIVSAVIYGVIFSSANFCLK